MSRKPSRSPTPGVSSRDTGASTHAEHRHTSGSDTNAHQLPGRSHVAASGSSRKQDLESLSLATLRWMFANLVEDVKGNVDFREVVMKQFASFEVDEAREAFKMKREELRELGDALRAKLGAPGAEANVAMDSAVGDASPSDVPFDCKLQLRGPLDVDMAEFMTIRTMSTCLFNLCVGLCKWKRKQNIAVSADEKVKYTDLLKRCVFDRLKMTFKIIETNLTMYEKRLTTEMFHLDQYPTDRRSLEKGLRELAGMNDEEVQELMIHETDLQLQTNWSGLFLAEDGIAKAAETHTPVAEVENSLMKIDMAHDPKMGNAILELKADREEINRMLQTLKDLGIDIGLQNIPKKGDKGKGK
jgi:hypothetical protein